jgi:phosphate acetyltransferase
LVLYLYRKHDYDLSNGGKEMFKQMIRSLKEQNRKIIFTEGTDARILEAASRLYKDGIMTPILLGNVDEIKKAAKDCGWSIEGIEVIDPANYGEMDAMVSKMVELRKGKMDEAACRAALAKSNYFGTMLVKMGKADCLLGGATYSTADTVRPALQLIKTKPGSKIVSSCFILSRETKEGTEMYSMADCAINLNPNEDELVEIALETARTARTFSIDPKVALLSYSTLGSGKGDTVDKMHNASEKLKAMDLDFPVDGELQFDAAFSSVVANKKAPGSAVAGKANTFVFPNIDAGNIGYKIAQRLGGFEAFGPILQGLNAPINDLSRGCNAEEVYKMSIITAALI